MLSRVGPCTRGTSRGCEASCSVSLPLSKLSNSRCWRTQPLRVSEGLRTPLNLRELSAVTRTEQQKQQQKTEQTEQPRSAATPAEADAASLFDFSSSHVAEWSPMLVLYFPFGVMLAVFRMCLWVGGVIIDSEWFKHPPVVSRFLRLLGFKAQWRNLDRLPAGRHIMVTNHVTPGDLLVMFEGLPQRYIHLITTAMPARCTMTKNLPLVLKYATPEVMDQLSKPAHPGEEEAAIHLHPEGGLTHGRWGMMQFSRGFTKAMRPGDWVVPVALKASTPWGIRTHTLLSSFPANFFWLSFCPWVHMEAIVLEPVQQQPDEPRGAFVKRVQQCIADELGLVVSECNITVKKRIMQQEASRRQRKQ